MTRVKLALMTQRLAPWPHPGPVIVQEGHDELEQLHLIDAWQHLATVTPGECDLPLEEVARSACSRRRGFEIDEYRIPGARAARRTAARAPLDPMTALRFVASSPRGFGDLLARELRELGASDGARARAGRGVRG
jgi:hypothetical protein